MSWIKPGFLWMMYRAEWATKENQQHILAITLNFKSVLNEATISSYDSDIYLTRELWQKELD